MQIRVSFKITEQSLENLKSEGVPDDVLKKLENIKNQEVTEEEKFVDILNKTIGEEQTVKFKSLIVKHAQISDECLMLKVKAGDMNALNEIVRRYEDRLLNFIYRMLGDFELAEDVRQEVFISVWQAAGRYEPKSNCKFLTWIYTIAVNRCINEIKKDEQWQIFKERFLYLRPLYNR